MYGPVRTVVWEGWSRKAPPYPDLWHIAAPDVCDGMSAVGESRHRIPGASVGQPTEPCLEMHNAAPADILAQALKIPSADWLPRAD